MRSTTSMQDRGFHVMRRSREHGGDVAGDIPAIAEHALGQVGPAKVPLHDVGTSDQHQPGLAGRKRIFGDGIHDPDGDAGKRMSDAAPLPADLPKTCRTEVVSADGHRGRTLGAAIPFERADSEFAFEGRREAFGQFLRSSQDDAQTAEVLRGAAVQVELEESGRGQQEGERIAAHEATGRRRIQRRGMVRHTQAQRSRETQGGRETEGVKKGQNTQHAVLPRQPEDLP